jgi:hypothetical protein
MALCTAVQLASCGSVHTGPKNIEADGVSYTACDGAIWFSNSNDLRDPLLKTYTVIFKDARGSRTRDGYGASAQSHRPAGRHARLRQPSAVNRPAQTASSLHRSKNEKSWSQTATLLSLRLDGDELDFKNQRGVGADLTACAVCTVGEIRWDEELPLGSDGHNLKRLGPTLDHSPDWKR